MKEETALNIQPHDEIELDGLKWVVLAVSIDMNATTPIRLDLRSIGPSRTLQTILCGPAQKFMHEHICG